MMATTTVMDSAQGPVVKDMAPVALPVPQQPSDPVVKAFQRALSEKEPESSNPSEAADEPSSGSLSEFNSLARQRWVPQRDRDRDGAPQEDASMELQVGAQAQPLVPAPLMAQNLSTVERAAIEVRGISSNAIAQPLAQSRTSSSSTPASRQENISPHNGAPFPIPTKGGELVSPAATAALVESKQVQWVTPPATPMPPAAKGVEVASASAGPIVSAANWGVAASTSSIAQPIAGVIHENVPTALAPPTVLPNEASSPVIGDATRHGMQQPVGQTQSFVEMPPVVKAVETVSPVVTAALVVTQELKAVALPTTPIAFAAKDFDVASSTAAPMPATANRGVAASVLSIAQPIAGVIYENVPTALAPPTVLPKEAFSPVIGDATRQGMQQPVGQTPFFAEMTPVVKAVETVSPVATSALVVTQELKAVALPTTPIAVAVKDFDVASSTAAPMPATANRGVAASTSSIAQPVEGVTDENVPTALAPPTVLPKGMPSPVMGDGSSPVPLQTTVSVPASAPQAMSANSIHDALAPVSASQVHEGQLDSSLKAVNGASTAMSTDPSGHKSPAWAVGQPALSEALVAPVATDASQSPKTAQNTTLALPDENLGLGQDNADEGWSAERIPQTDASLSFKTTESPSITAPLTTSNQSDIASAPRVDAQAFREVISQVRRTLAQRDLEALNSGRTVVISLPRGEFPVESIELSGDGNGGLASITLVGSSVSGQDLLRNRLEELSSVLRQDTPGLRLEVRSDALRVAEDSPSGGTMMGGSGQGQQGSQQPSRDDVARALDVIQQRGPRLAHDELLAAVHAFERRVVTDQ